MAETTPTGSNVVTRGRRVSYVGQEFLVSLQGLGTTGGAVLFTAPKGRRFAVVSFSCKATTRTSVTTGGFNTSPTAGGSVSLEHCSDAIAAGSGTNICATNGACDVSSVTNAPAADTLIYGTVNSTDGSTGRNILESGDTLRTLYTGNSGTLTALAGLSVQVILREIEPYKGA